MENNLVTHCRATTPSSLPLKHNHKYKNPFNFPTKKQNFNTDFHLYHLSKTGKISEAITALDSIARQGSKVKPITFIHLVQSCIDLNSIELGRELHKRVCLVEDDYEENPFVETKLVSMYAKCGSLDDARKVFDGMRVRNIYTWSAMIGGCCREKRWEEVVELFYLMMVEDGVLPDGFLFPRILQACGNCGEFETGRLVHSMVVRCGLSGFLGVSNSVLGLYVKCGEMSLARRFFESMEDRDVVSWNLVIGGCFQKGENDEARRLFDAMCEEEEIEPGLMTWNILIAGYSQSGCYDVARDLMKRMESIGVAPDVFTWTSMISGFSQNNRNGQALELFKDMLLAGVWPNAVTVLSALSACSSQKALNKGVELHSMEVRMGFDGNVLVGNSLIDMYSKCVELEAARKVFDRVKDKDIYTWNSMIGGYCQAGYCGKAYELFMKMHKSNVLPNAVTWNSMISGFMKNGDEDEAMYLFRKMGKEGIVERDTASWNSIIAGFVQNGQKDKALRVFRQMQSSCINPNSVTMLSILPAFGNLIAGKKVKEIHACVLRHGLESEISVGNSLIDTYSRSGNIGYPRAIFDRMSAKDVISWNSLMAGYVLHGLSDSAIDLFEKMKMYGFRPNKGTLQHIICACSLSGLVEEGTQTFRSITDDYQIVPTVEHYSAMVELYGRAGRLREAVEFIEEMKTEPESSVWSALLTASRVHGNVSLAVCAGKRLLELETKNFLIQWLLLQLYSLYGKSEAATKMRELEKDSGARKLLGQSWIEVQNVVHTFVSGARSHPQAKILYSWIQDVVGKVKVPDSPVALCIEEEEREEVGGVHSEKLAIAFALIGSPRASKTIRIVKNVRICDECHQIAKYISIASKCEIFITDSKCFHHFKNGNCSCGDYW